ncbi:Vacuolar protein sorting-associated protein Ist1 [Dillenia turbinata]|uniref:Vacuolar protein sorting-associated protein Ist1 n=1 Tax=Dillenia turbinata TaxID=194707 RepID=A0AAN8VB84_9MAGN
MKFRLSIFRRGFNSSKCKTMAKMATARMKLLRNKREVVVKQMRRDIALLLQSGQDATARIRVEHVIREQNILAANEIIELFCELIVARLQIIAKQRECPVDLKEGICSVIFAAPRCSEIPELLSLRNVFEKKYGKDFVSCATDLRPNCGVNRMLIEKLSVRTTTGEVKLKIMKEIAKEYQIDWDTTESEKELLKPSEDLIEGPCTFVSASSIPVKPMQSQTVERNEPVARLSAGKETERMQFRDSTSAAEAAAESAKKAIAAAQAAAFLANCNSNQVLQTSGMGCGSNAFCCPSGAKPGFERPSGCGTFTSMSNNPSINFFKVGQQQSDAMGRTHASQSFDQSHYHNEESGSTDAEGRKVNRRCSYNAPSAYSDIKFDESESEEEIEMEKPSYYPVNQPPEIPPAVPPSDSDLPFNWIQAGAASSQKQETAARVHPKLPDYDALAARFDALKYHKS